MIDQERSTKLLLDTLDEIKITSVAMRNCDYERASNVIVELDMSAWTFKWISMLLNELSTWKIDQNNGFRKQKRSNGQIYFFFRFISEVDPSNYIIFNITDINIVVKFSKSLVDSWTSEEVDLYSFKKSFYLKLTNKGTYAILRDSNLNFYSKEDFTCVFASFCLSFVGYKVYNKTNDTNAIYDFYDCFIKSTCYELIDFNALIQKTEGYMYFHLVKNNNTRKKLDKITIGGETFYILAGTYIAPFASSIVENPLINGMMLDTTFSTIQNYYVSIPTIIIQNTGIPIGFSFALTESEKIYNDFFERYENIFGYKLAAYVHVIESDQGTALKAAVSKQGVTHLICLRHLLVSLGRSKFSKQISNLVSCTCLKDLQKLIDSYSEAWEKIENEKDKKELSDILRKVGLAFIKNKIEIFDQSRWSQCSMLERIKYKMPSCTNNIESMHGHLNAKIPRRNEFFHSIKRLIDQIHSKSHSFNDRFNKNYARHKKKINDILKSIPPEIEESQSAYYETNLDNQTCTCGESALISSMLEVKIPCTHLVKMNVQFPEIQPPKILFENRFQKELFYEYEIHESKEVTVDSNYYSRIRKSVINTIKRFSHSESSSEISEYVNKNLPFTETPKEFVFGLPAEVFNVIDNGIRIFSKEIKNEKLNGNLDP